MRLNACRSLAVLSRHCFPGPVGTSSAAAERVTTLQRQVTRRLNPPPTGDCSSLKLSLLSCSKARCLLRRLAAGLCYDTMSLRAQPGHGWPFRCARTCRPTPLNASTLSPAACSKRHCSAAAPGCSAWRREFASSSLVRQPQFAHPWWQRSHGAPAAAVGDSGSCLGRWQHALSAHGQQRRAATAASADAEVADDDDAGLEAIAREVEAALPQYCAGCGIRLQRDDAHAPG